MPGVAIIDYGMGNLRSVANALERLAGGTKVAVTYDPDRIRQAERVVFPGVGALRDCMAELNRLGLDEVVRECAANKPFLGICLGMQALMQESEENGLTRGLGILPGKVLRFPANMAEGRDGVRLKVPHMGWNQVQQVAPHPLWEGIPQHARFYFVHSYYVAPEDDRLTAGTTDYGVRFASAIAKDNLFAVQFHPEKSQRCGLALLGNFLHWEG